MSHDHTPAELVRAALILAGLGTLPSAALAWPIYIGHLPDGADDPDQAVCVYDTAGKNDGRYMESGVVVEHPGWQLRVRALSHRAGFAKIKTLRDSIDTTRQQRVDLDGDLYKIIAMSRRGNIIPLGFAHDSKQRDAFTLNGTMTVAVVTP